MTNWITLLLQILGIIISILPAILNLFGLGIGNK